MDNRTIERFSRIKKKNHKNKGKKLELRKKESKTNGRSRMDIHKLISIEKTKWKAFTTKS